MSWKKYKHAYITFGIACAFSFFLWMLGISGILSDNNNESLPEITVISHLAEDTFNIRANTYIYEETKFLLCNTTETNYLQEHNHLIGKNVSQALQTEYPADEGWQADIINDEVIVFYKEVNSFCNKHINLRHFSAKDGYVVIMFGPRTGKGGIAEFTNILVSQLPEDLQLKIENRLLEFASHDDALQALDSFDEYQ
ncbi:MAG: hypothetical protein SCK28_08720 [Bacillota bacterium]|nr:hypothetical protein [Bacillota bacterium]